MKLIADSGSTKTDWCVTDHGKVIFSVKGQGINPVQQSLDTISGIVTGDVVDKFGDCMRITEIEFYGSGCRDDVSPAVGDLLRRLFPCATAVSVNSDMLGAARALFGRSPGIACILGTGANSCLYDGRRITANVPPLGYILGDEGSGAVLGRMFINGIFKGRLSATLRDEFLAETGLTLSDIINKVYRQPQANRFLAGASLFIHRHLDDKDLRTLVMDNFRNFFRRNVCMYGDNRDMPVGAVGSMAYYYEEQLREAASLEGYMLGKVLKSPIGRLAGI